MSTLLKILGVIVGIILLLAGIFGIYKSGEGTDFEIPSFSEYLPDGTPTISDWEPATEPEEFPLDWDDNFIIGEDGNLEFIGGDYDNFGYEDYDFESTPESNDSYDNVLEGNAFESIGSTNSVHCFPGIYATMG